MERRVLAAVDGSSHSLDAVRYLGSTFGSMEDFSIDLIHMILPAPPILVQEAAVDGKALVNLKMYKRKVKEQAETVLKLCFEELVRSGVSEKRIEKHLREARGGIAKSIVFEAQKGLYDALVLGRRGMGRLQEYFVGSVSQKCVNEATSVPVWLIDGEVIGNTVLLGLDGSEDSFKAVEYTGFVLSRHPEINVVLCHVDTSLARACPLSMDEEIRKLNEELMRREENRCLETYFHKSIQMLTEAGVENERIRVRFKTKGMEIARAIIQEARDQNATTVIVGRRGLEKGRNIFLGSISSRVIQQAQNMAVWVIV